ncbi:hypothetical protein MPTK1_2g23130 [Marchantia polymorpha subsp. ruderalis]|uniref:Uncharacterized protein n=1 Tax=Marchantia polymorpha TaxID=3197 RepID=A0A2R6WN38_MARPO|nr:hypothetical protein MARPO_0072s0018 [Marchantia polymorpha]BBN03390.1 hypothetical protein Mp_2g23130 [Marchantia polymorpha subsp. ruderalis]|eukprot:PTQ35261.1 hypothetical protein MARPO_0072s0018 [Marchantia polymorpha]
MHPSSFPSLLISMPEAARALVPPAPLSTPINHINSAAARTNCKIRVIAAADATLCLAFLRQQTLRLVPRYATAAAPPPPPPPHLPLRVLSRPWLGLPPAARTLWAPLRSTSKTTRPVKSSLQYRNVLDCTVRSGDTPSRATVAGAWSTRHHPPPAGPACLPTSVGWCIRKWKGRELGRSPGSPPKCVGSGGGRGAGQGRGRSRAFVRTTGGAVDGSTFSLLEMLQGFGEIAVRHPTVQDRLFGRTCER